MNEQPLSLIPFLALLCLGGCVAANRPACSNEVGGATERRQILYEFVGEVISVDDFDLYAGRKVVVADLDPHYVVVVKVVRRLNGTLPTGEEVLFAIHSPIELFGGASRRPVGRAYRWSVTSSVYPEIVMLAAEEQGAEGQQ